MALYGTKKSSIGEVLNHLLSAEPKMVSYKNVELKKFGTVPIFFRVYAIVLLFPRHN